MEIIQQRKQLCLALRKVLEKKQKRKQAYLRRQEELVQRCRNCSGAKNGPWYCEDCTTGLKLHMLDAEYSDVNNWWGPIRKE